MKTFLFVLVSLAGSIAIAGEIVLQPYTPSPFASEPFSQSALCHVQSLASGNWEGVCRYYGYHNTTAWALVTWNPTGTPLAAQPCWLYAFEGSPVCPQQTYGAFDSRIPGWLQGVSGDAKAYVIDTTPRYSVLITP